MYAKTRSATVKDDEPCTVMVHGTLAEDRLLRRVRSEFGEMPGMRLTLEQAMRLWMLDRDTCTDLLNHLVAARFLDIDSCSRYRKTHRGY